MGFVRRQVGIHREALEEVLLRLVVNGFVELCSLDDLSPLEWLRPEDVLGRLRAATHELLKSRGYQEQAYRKKKKEPIKQSFFSARDRR